MKLLMCLYGLYFMHSIASHSRAYKNVFNLLQVTTASPVLSKKLQESMMIGEWLTDEHISAAQRLLKNQFSHVGGLQSPLLAETNGFESVPSSGVQIHYCKHHWVTSSSIGEHVVVYDSKNVRRKLHDSLTVQLALIYRSAISHGKKGPALQIHIPSVMQQDGANDCGLFAIAFALHAALGDKVEELEFDQCAMRKHVLECLLNDCFMPFPHRLRVSTKTAAIQEVPLYCTCLLPASYDNLVQCSMCHKWFHMKCVGFTQEHNDWMCIHCRHIDSVPA